MSHANVINIAEAEAKGMARRHANGEYNHAHDHQTIDTIDCLVGRFAWDATRKKHTMRWPASVVDAAGDTLMVAR